MKCSECKFCKFYENKGGVNRYYCEHPEAGKAIGSSARLIDRTKRHEKELRIKTTPRWCPVKEVEANASE